MTLRDCICRWFDAGRRVATATVVRVSGSAPFGAGTMMAIDDAGDVFGTISNGCVESAVALLARDVFATGEPLERTFSSEDGSELADVSLLCGGTIDVRIEEIRADAVPRIFAATDAAATHLIVAGANDYARAIAELAAPLDYAVTVVDPRPAFVKSAGYARATVHCLWPDAYLETAQITRDTAILLLSHDTRYDAPFLARALASEAFYVGAMGSRRTQARRLERLIALRVPLAHIERLRAPIGLDLGGRTAYETGIAVLAEIIATRNGRVAAPLAAGAGPIHDPRRDTATDAQSPEPAARGPAGRAAP